MIAVSLDTRKKENGNPYQYSPDINPNDVTSNGCKPFFDIYDTLCKVNCQQTCQPTQYYHKGYGSHLLLVDPEIEQPFTVHEIYKSPGYQYGYPITQTNGLIDFS